MQRAEERIAAFQEARWGLFIPRELQLIQKALNTLLLELSSGKSIEDLTEAAVLLEGLQQHIEYRYFPPDSGVRPE